MLPISLENDLYPRSRLRDYQLQDAQRIATGESMLLLYEPGGGKTATVAHGLAWRFKGDALVVVVSTGTIVRTVWPAELAQWAETAHFSYTAGVGSPTQRKALVAGAVASQGVRMIGVTFDTVGHMVELLQGVEIDALVIDEISMARNPASNRFRSIIQLAARAKQRLGLTGSPTPNNIADIFGIVGLVDLGKALGTSHARFKSNFMVKVGQRAWQIAERPGARDEVLGRIKHMVSVVRTADVVDGMPTFTRNIISLTLPLAAMQKYREVESGLLDDDEIHDDAVLIKLQQVANGRVLDAAGNVQVVHDVKLDAAADLIDELLVAGEQVIVVYQFTADAQEVLKRWPDQSMWLKSSDAVECVKAWNEGLPILVLHSRSAGHGVNLQHAPRGGHMLWISGTWSSELYEQTVARIHRPGARRPTRVTLLSAEDTVDEVILRVLGHKINAQEIVKFYLLQRRQAAAQAPVGQTDVLARIAELRRIIRSSHPDMSGTQDTAMTFIKAKAELDALRQRLGEI